MVKAGPRGLLFLFGCITSFSCHHQLIATQLFENFDWPVVYLRIARPLLALAFSLAFCLFSPLPRTHSPDRRCPCEVERRTDGEDRPEPDDGDILQGHRL